MSKRDPVSLALGREAALAAEHMCIGVSALGRANYAEHAYYQQAFFALSTGFERTAKLALVLDHVATHNGMFPSNADVRGYKHDLTKLLDQVDGLAVRRGLTDQRMRLPRSPIHRGIIEVLSDFATNITRYYNLDLVTGDSRAASRNGPMGAWFERVIEPVIAEHYRRRHKEKHQRNARMIADMLDSHVLVRHTDETGDALDSAYAASLQKAETDFAKPYVRMYVMQIARFLALTTCEIADGAPGEEIPYMPDFFRLFNNSDQYFKQRKVWSIYRL